MNKVEILRTSGVDADVVSFARQSTASSQRVEDPRRLLRYLVRHGHTGPLATLTFDIYVECPISTARQWLRHGIGLRYCEQSLRFVTLDEMEYGGLDTPLALVTVQESFRGYEMLMERGAHREEARDVLPLGTMTKFRMAGNMEAMFNFLQKRMSPHAQEPIRLLAYEMWSQLRAVWPLTLEAYDDYVHGNDVLYHRKVRELMRQMLVTTDFAERVRELEGLGTTEQQEVLDAWT